MNIKYSAPRFIKSLTLGIKFISLSVRKVLEYLFISYGKKTIKSSMGIKLPSLGLLYVSFLICKQSKYYYEYFESKIIIKQNHNRALVIIYKVCKRSG